MQIPATLTCKTIMQARMARGGSLYTCRNDEFGVQRTDTRATRNDAWRSFYTADALPGREFATFRELRAAMARLTEAA